MADKQVASCTWQINLLQVNKLNIKSVFTIRKHDVKIAQMVKQNLHLTIKSNYNRPISHYTHSFLMKKYS